MCPVAAIQPPGFINSYFPEIKEQIWQDSILAGNNIIKSLILEYAIFKQNAKRKNTLSFFLCKAHAPFSLENSQYTILKEKSNRSKNFGDFIVLESMKTAKSTTSKYIVHS